MDSVEASQLWQRYYDIVLTLSLADILRDAQGRIYLLKLSSVSVGLVMVRSKLVSARIPLVCSTSEEEITLAFGPMFQ